MHVLGDEEPDPVLAAPPAIWLAPPVPAREVRRRRLYALVAQGLHRPVTVVVAPAGAGKTRLLACFADTHTRDGRPVRWLAADRHTDLGSALLHARGLDGPRPAGGSTESRHSVVDRLQATLPHPADPPEVVVIDDAHRLPPPELDLLSHALLRCPTAVRVVLLARRNPLPIPLQLTLGDAVTVIRGRQLAFDSSEARQLVLVHAPGSSDQDIDKVLRLSGGWAAPLVMGARTLSAAGGSVQPRALLEHLEQDYLDYLLGDYLQRLSDVTRQVLSSCCQEEDLDAEQALALSGVADAIGHIAGLAADGLATSTVDESRPGGLTWVLHPLLKEALRRSTSPSSAGWPVAVQAHVRAAAHYAAAEDAVRAVRHAHRSGDAATVTQMLTRFATLLVPSESASEVAAGLLCLPESVKATAPHLRAIEALLHRAEGRIDLALARAHEACDLPSTRSSAGSPGLAPDRHPAEAAAVAAARLWRATLGWGDLEGAISEAEHLLSCATSPGAGHTHSATDLTTSQAACLMVELAAAQTWNGDLTAASVHLQEAQRAADVLGSAPLLASALAHRCVLELAAGNYRTAGDTAATALAADPTGALPDDVRARAHLALGWAATYTLNSRAAKTTAKIFATRPPPVDPFVRNMLTLLRCRILNQDGEGGEALRLLAESRVTDGAPRFLLRFLSVIEAETAARAHCPLAVRAASARLRELGFEDEAELFDCLAPQDPAAFSAVRARLDTLLLKPDLHPATSAGAAALRMTLLVAHDPLEASEMLADFLGRVHPQRLLVFLDVVAGVSPAFVSMLAVDVERGPSHPAAPEALAIVQRTRPRPVADADRLASALPGAASVSEAALDLSAPDLDAAGVVPRLSAPLVQLTQRQADVLMHLAAGASYSDIARNLYVTENTVKTHLISLYRKLEVNRRSEALRRARDLGLI